MLKGSPPVTVPVEGSINAPSLGALANAKVPPVKPVIVAVAPSQVGVKSNEESSACNELTWIIVVVWHNSEISYNLNVIVPLLSVKGPKSINPTYIDVSSAVNG